MYPDTTWTGAARTVINAVGNIPDGGATMPIFHVISSSNQSASDNTVAAYFGRMAGSGTGPKFGMAVEVTNDTNPCNLIGYEARLISAIAGGTKRGVDVIADGVGTFEKGIFINGVSSGQWTTGLDIEAGSVSGVGIDLNGEDIEMADGSILNPAIQFDVPCRFLVYLDGADYKALDVDTGVIDYTSTDPVSVIESAIGDMNDRETIIIRDDFTVTVTTGTVNIDKNISYIHEGVMTVVGAVSGLTLGAVTQIGQCKFKINRIVGTLNTVGEGIELSACIQSIFEIGQISTIAIGIHFNSDRGNLFFNSDNLWTIGVMQLHGTAAIQFDGDAVVANRTSGEGNQFVTNVFSSAEGILIADNANAGLGVFTGVLDNLDASGQDYTNNMTTGGWLINGKFIREAFVTKNPLDYWVNANGTNGSLLEVRDILVKNQLDMDGKTMILDSVGGMSFDLSTTNQCLLTFPGTAIAFFSARNANGEINIGNSSATASTFQPIINMEIGGADTIQSAILSQVPVDTGTLAALLIDGRILGGSPLAVRPILNIGNNGVTQWQMAASGNVDGQGNTWDNFVVSSTVTGVSGITGLGVQTQNLDMDDFDIILDADADSLIGMNVDDQIKITAGTTSAFLGFNLFAFAAAAGAFPIIRGQSDESVAGNVVCRYAWQGHDSAAVEQEYAEIDAVVRDNTAANPDGSLRLRPMVAGVATTFLECHGLNGDIDILQDLDITDAKNLVLDTTTGTKIGTATGQKIGFWNATPVIQQSHVADPTGGATVDAEARTAINSILAQLATIGLQAAS